MRGPGRLPTQYNTTLHPVNTHVTPLSINDASQLEINGASVGLNTLRSTLLHISLTYTDILPTPHSIILYKPALYTSLSYICPTLPHCEQ